jgi:SHS2 domain-containing protein
LDKAVFCDVEVIQLTETSFEASVSGVNVEHFVEDLKAVTYHEAEVRQTDDGYWETMIIFDI